MAKKSRRFLALVLTLILAFSLLPISGIADGTDGAANTQNKIMIHDGTGDNSLATKLNLTGSNGNVTFNINGTEYSFNLNGSKFEYARNGSELQAADLTAVPVTADGYTLTLKKNGNGNGQDNNDTSTTNIG